jgi:hypothetical protein
MCVCVCVYIHILSGSPRDTNKYFRVAPLKKKKKAGRSWYGKRVRIKLSEIWNCQLFEGFATARGFENNSHALARCWIEKQPTCDSENKNVLGFFSNKEGNSSASILHTVNSKNFYEILLPKIHVEPREEYENLICNMCLDMNMRIWYAVCVWIWIWKFDMQYVSGYEYENLICNMCLDMNMRIWYAICVSIWIWESDMLYVSGY